MRSRILIRSTWFLLFVFAFLSCKKDKNDDDPDPIPTPTPAVFAPAITAAGAPSGNIASMSIGLSGGSVFSDDGRLQVIIPANALISDTNISIEEISNMCPGGKGNGYRLSPDGQEFTEPVTLVFHYSVDDLAGATANVLRMATQFSDGSWNRFFNYALDEGSSTLSITTTHFSDYCPYSEYIVLPEEATIQVNQSQEVILYYVPWQPDEEGELQSLGAQTQYQDPQTVSWAVNGDLASISSDGWMTPGEGSAVSVYHAPAHINSMSANPAAVSATFPIQTGTVVINSFVTVQELGEQYTLHFAADYAMLNYTTPFCQLDAGYIDGFDVNITINADTVVVNSLTNMTPGIAYHSVACDCLSLTFNQGSLIEFSNFSATSDGAGTLYFEYVYSWDGSDDVYECDGDQATIPGTDFTESDLGNTQIPQDPVALIETPWGLGTLTITHEQ